MEKENEVLNALSDEEMAEFRAFQKERKKKEEAARKQAEREAYYQMIEEAIEDSMPELVEVSKHISQTKESVRNRFNSALEIKSKLFDVKEDQKTHTFTNQEGTKRITLGHYVTDGYRDTVNEGIAIVKEYISSLAKDSESQTLVSAVLRLLSRNQQGELKASRVLQLRRMADESTSDKFKEGVRIIEESYMPTISKQFVRVELKNESGVWESIPLGMTEA